MAVSGTKEGHPDNQTSALPVLYTHCVNVYEKMLEQSSREVVKDDGEERTVIVYEGFLTKLVTEELHLSVPYYTTVMRALKKMGCASQLRRGGSTTPSQWVLFREPTEDLFTSVVQKPKGPTSQYQHRMDQMEDMIQTMNSRVLSLEGIVTALVQEKSA